MVLRTRSRTSACGMTLLEVVIALVVLTILLTALGAAFGSLGNQSALNRELAVVTSEVGNALSLVHTAPFDTIAQDLAQNGFLPIGNFVYRKDLAAPPSSLPGGRVDIALVGVTASVAGGNPIMPDPLHMNVSISWDTALGAASSRTFSTVRTR